MAATAGIASRPPVVPYDLGGRAWAVGNTPPRLSLAKMGIAADAVPAVFDLSGYVKRVYDQGNVPACTCYSVAAMQSIFEAIEQGQWMAFDALECYRAVGGTGAIGVDSASVLAYAQSTGLLASGTVHRYRIETYAAVRLGPGGQLEPIKAAVATRRPVVMAMLLPEDWGQDAGQSAGGNASGTLHQVCLTGYDDSRFYFVNSQGSAWGDEGFGSVPTDFVLRAEQTGYSYAFTTIDAVDD